MINLDKQVLQRFKKKKRRIEDVSMKEIYTLLSEHTFFQSFDGHPQTIKLVASMTIDYTLSELY